MESFQPPVVMYTAQPTAKNSLIDDDLMSTTVTTQSVTAMMVTSDFQVSDTDFECW